MNTRRHQLLCRLHDTQEQIQDLSDAAPASNSEIEEDSPADSILLATQLTELSDVVSVLEFELARQILLRSVLH